MPTRRDVHWNLIKQTIFSRNMWSHTGWPINCDTKSFLSVTISIPFSVFNWYQLFFFRSVQIVFTSQFCLRHIFFRELFTFFYVWIWKLQKYKEIFFIQINFFLKLFHLGHSQIQYGYQNRLVYADIFFR